MGMKFMHLPKSKQFNITTRFYDPQKEAMKEREERIKRESGQSNGEGTISHYSAGIKGQFRNSGKMTQSKTVAEARRKSNMRLFYIVIILSILFYILLK
ncbi:MAG TPA: hypothetical protein VFC65_09750 [Prolixibacteraceae bacterium]|nr:hypothetical protein [Prolixibacteraceae bacterium]